MAVISAGGGAPKQLSNVAGVAIPISWHPDGDRVGYIATSAGAGGGTFRSFVTSVSHGGSLPLIPDEQRPNIGEWSPDGSRIGYLVIGGARGEGDRRARAADGREYRHGYDALVLSPGAEPLRPPIPGIEHPLVRTLRNMEDLDAILEALAVAPSLPALVAGAGYIGLEMAEALRQRGLDVVLVERLPQVMGVADPEMVAPLHEELRRHDVELRLGRPRWRRSSRAATASSPACRTARGSPAASW